MTTTTPPEPIGTLLARSSLGTHQVRVLAAGASSAVVQQILLQVASSFEHPARTSGITRIYSNSEHQTPPTRSRKE
jgi:hypothetical protein